MTVKMGDDNQTSKVVIVEATQAEHSSNKSSVTKKRLIVAGATVLVAVVVIAGILIGVKFFLDSQKDIVTRTLEFVSNGQKDKPLQQDVTTDLNENIIQYHLKDDGKEIWTIEDYNRDIKVFKVRNPSGDIKCFVAPLNGTDGTVEAARNANFTSESLDRPTQNTDYVIAQKPIKQKSILGPTGEALCANIDAYWLTPSCNTDVVTNVRNRVKRCTRVTSITQIDYICYCPCCRCWHWCGSITIIVEYIVICGIGGNGTGGMQ